MSSDTQFIYVYVNSKEHLIWLKENKELIKTYRRFVPHMFVVPVKNKIVHPIMQYPPPANTKIEGRQKIVEFLNNRISTFNGGPPSSTSGGPQTLSEFRASIAAGAASSTPDMLPGAPGSYKITQADENQRSLTMDTDNLMFKPTEKINILGTVGGAPAGKSTPAILNTIGDPKADHSKGAGIAMSDLVTGGRARGSSRVGGGGPSFGGF